MTKENLIKNDISNLLMYLEDCINRFYDLDVMDDDDVIEALGLNFTYRSLIKYVERFQNGKDN